jgi:hypothetical protein
MDKQILNCISQILAYKGVDGTTDNPSQRSFDWTRKLYSISISNPKSDSATIPAGGSLTLFDGTRPNPLDGTSVLDVALIPGSPSVYRLKVIAGTSGFKTKRAITVTACTVAVNNNAVATFDFTGGILTSVAVGDILRINGSQSYDTGPYAFNPLNAGQWIVIGKAGTVLTCVRPTGQAFSAVAETVASSASDVMIYAQDGIQDGDKFDVSAVLSPVSQRTYTVKSVTPDFIDFVSTIAIPNETGLTYASGAITFYTNLKKFVAIEVNQEAVVRFNDDSGNSNRLTPIVPGDALRVGYQHKWGDTYKCVVVNRSVNPLDVRFFTAE